MYGQSGNSFPRATEFEGLPMSALGSFGAYNNTGGPFGGQANEFSNNNSGSSGCSSYGGSPTYASSSAATTACEGEPSSSTLMMIQRSVSSHSLHSNNNCGTHRLVSDLLELETGGGSVRRVYSTGDMDLQQLHCSYKSSSENSPLSSESSMIIEGMTKACRYSPEEKKEKIERYKSKRNLRNFNKTIKYACRKTLADSRPRIRGRFARNEEIDQKNSPNGQWSQISEEEDDEDGDSWINLLDAFSSIESNSLI